MSENIEVEVWELVWEEEYEPDWRLRLWVGSKPSREQILSAISGTVWRLEEEQYEEAVNALCNKHFYGIDTYHSLSLNSFTAEKGESQ